MHCESLKFEDSVSCPLEFFFIDCHESLTLCKYTLRSDVLGVVDMAQWGRVCLLCARPRF